LVFSFNAIPSWNGRPVVIAKLQYASSAWWGLTTVAERHRIDAFIRRSARCRFVPPDSLSFETLCRTADEKLFKNITTNNQSCQFYIDLAVNVARFARLQSPPTQAQP